MKTFNRVLALALSLSLPLSSQAAVLGRVNVAPTVSVTAPIVHPTLQTPLSVGNSLALSPLITPSVTPIVASPLMTAPQAQPSLENLTTQLAVSQPGSSESALTLDRAFTGVKPAASFDTPVPAGDLGGHGSQLIPSTPLQAPSPSTPPSGPSDSAGKRKFWVIGGIAAAVIGIAVLISVMVHNGNKKNETWQKSQAAQEVVQVDQYRRSGDAAALFKLSDAARARQKTDADKTTEAFDGIVAMRGAVNGNALSTEPSQRPGGQLVSTWKSRLEAEESGARQSGNIKQLSLALSALDQELAKEDSASGVYQQDLSKFDAEVPAFGGALGEQSAKAQKDLGEFKSEVSAEKQLHARFQATMTSIVADHLSRTDPAFKAAQERSQRLSDLSNGTLGTLDNVAANIDRDLADMGAHRRAQREQLDLAKQHTADAVVDSAGKPMYDADGKAITQDNSRPYLDQAAKEAAAAQASAASAKSNIEAFNRDLSVLRRDGKLQQEGFDKALPKSAASGSPDYQHGVYKDLLDPWTLENSAKDFTEAEANDARARFGTAKGQVQSVQQQLEARKAEQRKAIDKAIQDEIARQTKSW